MNFLVLDGRIVGDSEDGLSAGQLKTGQIWKYLEDCDNWNDELVFPLFHELCDRLKIDFDEYDTYDDLECECYNKMVELVEQAAKADFQKQDFEQGPIMNITMDEAIRRLKDHREEESGIPIWPDEYIHAWNNLLMAYILDDNLTIKPVRWCK